MAHPDVEQWLVELLDLIERSRFEIDATGSFRPRAGQREADNAVQGWVVGFLRIAGQFAPGVASKVDLTTNPGLWGWADLERKVRMVLGAVREAERIDAMLGPQGPVVAVSGMHPEMAATSARLFDQGHYREAVLRAARNVNDMTKDKLEVAGADGVALVQQAWSPNPPQPNQPRLRVPGVDPEREERMWRDLHQGAMQYGVGLFTRIRNVVEHGSDQLDPTVSGEYLAAVSVYARWVDAAEVKRAQCTDRGRLRRSTVSVRIAPQPAGLPARVPQPVPLL